MKHIKTFALMLALGGLMVSCKDDDMKNPGNPVMEITGNLGEACFGDILRFDIKASDSQVPLSTIHAELYFDSELVSEQVIRTKVNGETYPVEVYIPYIANIPDGQATLRLTLQNINFTTTEQVYGVNISHADYPYLTFVADNGTEYTMTRVSMYNYEVTDNFDDTMPGKIVAPAEGGATDEVIFGYEGGEIKVNGTGSIPFSGSGDNGYTISLNTFTLEGSPFMVMSINDTVFEDMGNGIYQADFANLAKGSTLTFEGFPAFDEWTINPDYFQENPDGTFSFMAYDGNYRVVANTKKQYFEVIKLSGGVPASLNTDGTGLVWIKGNGIGYPEYTDAPGWDENKGIPMAPQSEYVYQVTVIGGKSINISNIDFKFFGVQQGWDNELKYDMLTSQSNLIGVGDGIEQDGVKHDNGNLYLLDGVKLEANTIYKIILDLTGGINNAILKTEVAGENQFEEVPVSLNGQKMDTYNNSTYSLVVNLNQNDKIELTGNVDMSEIYVDPDYFKVSDSGITLNAISGYYNVILDKESKNLKAEMTTEGGEELTLQPDGSGALWLMGWGVGSPSLDYQFAWVEHEAYCVAQVSPGVYQFTGKAGPEKESVPGDRFRADYLSFKYFWQNGWGGEFNDSDNVLSMTGTASDYLQMVGGGNLELATGVTLTEGDTYRVTVDLSNGVANGTINFEKL